MPFKILETVSLAIDLPKHMLSKGCLGAIVEVYDDDVYEVEFIDQSGRTTLLPLTANILRKVTRGVTSS